MTVKEMSDSLDSLLNSYASQAAFGEEASKQDIVLDEYEKSLYLTQAQDIVLKGYFQRTTNGEGTGFDDSEKRQIDFSSLITVRTLTQAASGTPFDERGILYSMPKRMNDNTEIDGTTDVLFILNEQLKTSTGGTVTPAHWSKQGQTDVKGLYTDAAASRLPHGEHAAYTSVEDAESDGWSWTARSTTGSMDKSYVIVPINYKEYDREMSKPYAQPLKKQCWRLFQNTGAGFDYLTELIPTWDLETKETITGYKMRYVRRPNPIVLIDLPDGLSVEGFSKENACELNPILHPEIVQKAVDIIIVSRGGVANLRKDSNR